LMNLGTLLEMANKYCAAVLPLMGLIKFFVPQARATHCHWPA
jgi:hypothetical protein